ncbi:MAG: MFS transporter [Candidatus Marinimicrobia bacterium]|nr:MFS transporter [Candidatus Neomarinimicrobiota bacterium]MCF7828926.1 MFS transporter [Candidatus Neomarinimicrobiota bacterium]MCF7879886.1 MFS transporter [Candidatus Neomarinimicrobiota bacterium]
MKIKGLRWWIIVLIAIATVINYIDRSALGIMWPDIQEDLGMTKGDYAIIVTMFTIAYALSQTLSGKLYDWIGTRMGFVISIVVWSLSVAGHGLARGLASFSAFRFIMGLGEAGNWPGAVKSNAEWHPVKERALAQGIFNSGASIGSIVAPPLVAWLFVLYGWKITFFIIGALGLLWIIPWLVINKALPKNHPWISDQERDFILEGQKLAAGTDDEGVEAEERIPGWSEILSYKETWSVLISRFFLDPIWWMFLFWLPIYLAESFGFDIKQIGYFAWVPYVGAAAGSIFGGWLAGRFMDKGWTTNKARKWTITFGGVLMLGALIGTSYAVTPLLAVLLIAVILFGFQTAIGNIQTLPSDFYSGGTVGTVAGMGGTTAAIGVIITTNIVPIITQTSYVPFFLMGAMLVPLGIFAVYLLGGDIKRVELKIQE